MWKLSMFIQVLKHFILFFSLFWSWMINHTYMTVFKIYNYKKKKNVAALVRKIFLQHTNSDIITQTSWNCTHCFHALRPSQKVTTILCSSKWGFQCPTIHMHIVYCQNSFQCIFWADIGHIGTCTGTLQTATDHKC